MNPFPLLVGAAGLILYSGVQAARGSGYVVPDPTGGGVNLPIDYSGSDTSGEARANLASFLYLLRVGESSDDYGALVGGGSFTDYSHHPGWTDSSMVKKSDWPGRWNSHAAGAYQFQPGTFKIVSDRIGLGGVFTPNAQDEAAIYNLERKGAYQDILDGRIEVAFSKLTKEWTSLHDKGLRWVLETYEWNGGTLA